ncbi:MAG: minor capsid protein [Proteobacteria bacterium]|nr:minor capsid protein [Pseudomonadota bacterium]
MVVNANAYDPTRTLSIRNAFVQALNKRFNQLKGDIIQAVLTDDVFDLQKPITTYQTLSTYASPGPKAFQFASSAEKVNLFSKWLQGRVDAGILQTSTQQQVGKAIESSWANIYIEDSYKKGVIRARYELQKRGFGVPGMDATGGIGMSMATPLHADRLGLLYSRAYSELKGITTAMDTQISRILSQGIADGDNPRLLARKLVSAIDGSGAGTLGITDTLGRFIPAKRRAEIMARTEIIRAHHKATIQEYRNWGVEGVDVQAEFRTAGDDRVCSQCASLQGTIWTLDEIENKIPVHPQCRCFTIPILPGEEAEEKTELQQQIEADPVASQFYSEKEAAEYLKLRKEYDAVFAEMPDDLKEIIRKLSNEPGSRIWDDPISNKLKLWVQENYKGEFFLIDDAAYEWMSSTQKLNPQVFKAVARSVEKGLPEMVFKVGTAQEEEVLRYIAEKGLDKLKNNYTHWRAFNQSMMNTLYDKQSMELFRGMGGNAGGKVVNDILNAYKKHGENALQRNHLITDKALVGYADNFISADDFSKAFVKELYEDMTSAKLIMRSKVPLSDIITPKEFWSGIFRTGMAGETEYVVKGYVGKKYKLSSLYVEIVLKDGRTLLFDYGKLTIR